MHEDDGETTGSMVLLQQLCEEPIQVSTAKVSELVENRAERAVLRQIVFWYPKAKHKRNGDTWLVKSAEEFREEGVDFAPATIRRAVRALVKRGVITTTRHFHPFRAVYGPVYFIKPEIEVIDDYAKSFRKMSPW